MADKPTLRGEKPCRRSFYWLEVCLALSIVCLIIQLLLDVIRLRNEWPHPGYQTRARAELSFSNGMHSEVQYLVYLPQDYTLHGSWPLLIYLHGSGERGNDLETVLRTGLPALIARGKHFPMIVVSPQCRPEANWESGQLLSLPNHLEKEFSIDRERVYIGGYSMGGFGTWQFAAAAPERFAAIIPVAGGGDPSEASRLVNLPIWAFHGAKDRTIPLAGSKEMVEAVQAAGGNARLTIYDDRGHDTCNLTFSRDDLYEWLLRQRRRR